MFVQHSVLFAEALDQKFDDPEADRVAAASPQPAAATCAGTLDSRRTGQRFVSPANAFEWRGPEMPLIKTYPRLAMG